jgi:hypothetical protein
MEENIFNIIFIIIITIDISFNIFYLIKQTKQIKKEDIKITIITDKDETKIITNQKQDDIKIIKKD